MDGRLDGKVVMIAGGAGLLGRALSRAVVEAGARLMVADASEEAARSVSRELGASSRAACMNITTADSVRGAILECTQAFGRLDAVVNAAYPRNSHYGRKLEDVEYADFCENVGLHLGGYFLVCQQACAHFRRSGGGSVVNISSIYGIRAPRFDVYEGTPMTMPVEYAAIKAGLLRLTEYFAKYYAGSSIRVNSLSLGGIADRQPESFQRRYRSYCLDKGMLDAADVTGALVFLLSDAGRYVNGHNLVVDDGWVL
jgi:NAD(P)-dependent dehydrogenase (short-subunit alcohol dehydrogenase family)